MKSVDVKSESNETSSSSNNKINIGASVKNKRHVFKIIKIYPSLVGNLKTSDDTF